MPESLLGYEIFDGGATEAVCQIMECIAGHARAPSWLACINPHSYAVAKTDHAFRSALSGATWLVPDGIGIVWAARALGSSHVNSRVTGSDVFEGVMASLNAYRGSVFFLGSTVETLALIRARVALDYPGVRVAGTYSPPFSAAFSDAESEAMIEAINVAAPDVLWVGMTAPKQEKWIFEHKDRLRVRFAGAIGAVFDFYAGRVRRPSRIYQQLGLEWLPRLAQEPQRLWRRMLVSAPIFLTDVVGERLSRRRAPSNGAEP